MKISKRSLLIMISLMLALTTAALGTVAYMTSQDTVVNTFTVGNIGIIVDEEDTDGSQKDPTTPGTPSTPGTPTYPDTNADVDGDGTADKIVVSPDGTITIIPGDPTPEDDTDNRNPIVITPDADGTYPDTDLNGDNTPDIKIEKDENGKITITPIDPTPDNDADNREPIVITPVPGAPTPGTPGRDRHNEYNMIPGKEYKKDPTLTVVKGSEECYVRMIVEMNCYGVLSNITQKTGIDLLKEFVGAIDPVWQLQGTGTVAGDVITYEFRYAGDPEKISAAADDVVLPALFKTFTTPPYFTGAHLSALGNMFKIDVDGHAIQTESFNNAEEAWTAFEGQNGK